VILRGVHRALGLATLAVFLASGAYMRFVAHPDALGGEAHLMYLSRHMYVLAAALVHLALAAYASPLPSRPARATQWVGTWLLVASSVLLVAAFVVEPVGGRPRTGWSTYGMYALFGGTLLHFATTSFARGPRREAR
jgi:heme/copper-type cytochrome/quinol oxidase subunit 1